MGFFRVQGSIGTVLMIVISLVLVASFGVHSIQPDHAHPGHEEKGSNHGEHAGHTVSEYLHGAEKEMFLFLLLAFFALGSLLIGCMRPQHTIFNHIQCWQAVIVRAKRSVSTFYFSYITFLFCVGILHPKIH